MMNKSDLYINKKKYSLHEFIKITFRSLIGFICNFICCIGDPQRRRQNVDEKEIKHNFMPNWRWSS